MPSIFYWSRQLRHRTQLARATASQQKRPELSFVVKASYNQIFGHLCSALETVWFKLVLTRIGPCTCIEQALAGPCTCIEQALAGHQTIFRALLLACRNCVSSCHWLLSGPLRDCFYLLYYYINHPLFFREDQSH